MQSINALPRSASKGAAPELHVLGAQVERQAASVRQLDQVGGQMVIDNCSARGMSGEGWIQASEACCSWTAKLDME